MGKKMQTAAQEKPLVMLCSLCTTYRSLEHPGMSLEVPQMPCSSAQDVDIRLWRHFRVGDLHILSAFLVISAIKCSIDPAILFFSKSKLCIVDETCTGVLGTKPFSKIPTKIDDLCRTGATANKISLSEHMYPSCNQFHPASSADQLSRTS
ncbi:hypothetical protein K443DRAFT_413099 [Laccaria amethystina LaAM-08-1]|uniref:Uncharacterized protein n=1 Tax=Laccaria amethystina LaAM-08-1 TaxID=1095629 RepID=A0A0C9WIK2_9AGAR|nr:hypothetical protein K443DRAFT_413099 [Laccaria amethystina LaAM-08-1]